MTQTIASTDRRLPSVLITFALTGAATFAIWGGSLVMREDSATVWHNPSWAVALHLATVLPALPLGAWVLTRPKGDATHKSLGRIWAALMMVAAISSLWLRGTTGGFGPIHIFTVVTLVSIPLAIWHIRQGLIDAHRRAMRGTYIGLVVAGLFSVVPGRILGNLVFG